MQSDGLGEIEMFYLFQSFYFFNLFISSRAIFRKLYIKILIIFEYRIILSALNFFFVLDTRPSWVKVPFYPTNSVYEVRHATASTSDIGQDRSSLLLLDENNVRDPSKAKVISHDEDDEDEEEYVDEDYEADLESEQDPRGSRVLKDYENEDPNQEKKSLNHTTHLNSTNKNSIKSNSTQHVNHQDDFPASQYDSYYYYDDYENDTHSAEGKFTPRY